LIEPDMAPGTFHGMFTDKVDVQSWANHKSLNEYEVMAVWQWVEDHMEIDAWRAARAMRINRSGGHQAEPNEHSVTPTYNKRCMPIALTGTTNTAIQTKALKEDDKSRSAKTQKKLAAFKEYLYELYIAVGSLGTLWMIAECPNDIQTRKDIFIAKFEKFTNASTLTSKVSNWRRWREWAGSQGISIYTPRDLQVAQYILSRSKGGPQAANGVYQALLFIETYVGINMHTRSPNVRSIGEKKPKQSGEAAKQAEIATPSMFLRMFRFCEQKLEKGEQGTVVVLVMFVMEWMIACIRSKHAQISWVTLVSSRFIHLWCPEGKRKVQGVRVPFAWVIPRKMGPGLDVWPYINQVYQALRTDDAPVKYFIPDVQVSAWEDVGALTAWQARPMPYDKLNKLYRGLANAIGVASDWAAMMTSYTPRRFGPTCCGALGYDEEQMQALSNWQEIPEHPGKVSKARFVMSRHYDGSTDLLSGDLKGILVVALHHAFIVQDNDPAITKDHLEEELAIFRKLKMGNGPTKLEETWMSAEWQTGCDKVAESDIQPAVKERNNPFEPIVCEVKSEDMNTGNTEEDADASSSDTSSSVSNDEPETCDQSWQDQCWFIQQEMGPTHFVASTDWRGQLIPYCRVAVGTPFTRQPHIDGSFGKLEVLTGRTKGAHLACLLKISPSASKAWKNFLGDHSMIQD
jgi:hypothetical protein